MDAPRSQRGNLFILPRKRTPGSGEGHMSEAAKSRRVAPESWIILVVGMLDMVTTLVWIDRHGAREANPIFQSYLQLGVPAFIVAKISLLVAPICLLEYARRHRPRFT